jgi:hypothetical protein
MKYRPYPRANQRTIETAGSHTLLETVPQRSIPKVITSTAATNTP